MHPVLVFALFAAAVAVILLVNRGTTQSWQAPVAPPAAIGTFAGRVGGAIGGYSFYLHALPGGALTGRFGGNVFGKDLNLEFDGTHLRGRYGGGFAGKDLTAEVRAGLLSGRVGGDFVGNDLTLGEESGHITGRVGGPVLGFDVDVLHDPVAGTLHGRFGGNDLQATIQGIPPLVATAVAAAVYFQRRQERNRSGGGGGS